MIRLFMAAALLLALIPPPFTIPLAQADAEPPRYDVDGLCFRQANTPDGVSDVSVAQCLSRQSEALDAIRHNWDATPAYIQDDCDVRTRATGDPDYTALENCIQTQMRQDIPQGGAPGAAASTSGD
jgi:hypothetical protein